jgi:two-component system chemotaxis response regulator CheB
MSGQYKAIIIGGSAGSFSVVSKILAKLNSNFSIPIIICLHRLKHIRSGLVEGINIKSNIKVVEPFDKEKIRPNFVYLAPSNYHLIVEFDGTITLSTEETNNHSRPSIDYTFSSAANTYREKCLGILLTGANKDGAKGMKDVFDRKGFTIIQDPTTCDISTMPLSALKLFNPNLILTPDQIADFLNNISQNE